MSLLLCFQRKTLSCFGEDRGCLPKESWVCIPGFTFTLVSPMGPISSDGCIVNDLAIPYPRIGARKDTDNYPRFLVQCQSIVTGSLHPANQDWYDCGILVLSVSFIKTDKRKELNRGFLLAWQPRSLQ